jgi:hypothetical protein
MARDAALGPAYDPAYDPSRHPAWRALQERERARAELPADGGLLIDCGSCTVRGDACGDCVVTVMLGCAPGPVELDADERRALEVLGRSGMVPHLRLAGTAERPDSA